MAGDTRFDFSYRVMAARRAWDLHRARGTGRTGGPAVYEALKDLPPARWNADLLVGVARGLREAGMTEQARTLLRAEGLKGVQQAQVALERALTELREGPPQRVLPDLAAIADQSPEAQFRYAEALFFAGQADSAKAVYEAVTRRPDGPYTGAALERIYLIEDAAPKTALPAFGQLAYREWRGEDKAAMGLADSLYRSLPKGALWAQAAMALAAKREAAGDANGALEPLIAVAEQRPDDRLASLARQRAGDIYLFKLKDDAKAEAQYEECLTRYPRAWNAAEVRRRVESIRRRRL
jgi:tetratricopeptide (TPR) repeat protein